MAYDARKSYVDRAVESLHGVIAGISCDYVTSDEEITRLRGWIEQHHSLHGLEPFKTVLAELDRILEDSVIDEDEREEFLEWCHGFLDGKVMATDSVTTAIRRVHGFLQGIVIDGVIDDHEVYDLRDWLEEYEWARDAWPFGDVWALVERIVEDGKISPEERMELEDFCAQFVEIKQDCTVVEANPPDKWMQNGAPHFGSVDGLFEATQVTIPDRRFCFTGKARTGKRADLQAKVEEMGGIVAKSISCDLDYLVIGALSQPAWIYATYGRKVEQVLANRHHRGAQTKIVSEAQFKAACGTASD